MEIEEREPCTNCGHTTYRKEIEMKLYNSNGEFVEGYGHSLVFVPGECKYYCVSCGWLEGASGKRADVLSSPNAAFQKWPSK